tara:strand:+ start:12820 stop:12927 length:108 start_codon:yes stop_codon:yes gene_type:complete
MLAMHSGIILEDKVMARKKKSLEKGWKRISGKEFP